MKIKSNPIQTVLTIAVGFLILSILFKWEWAVTVALLIGLGGLISRKLAQKIEWIWHKLSYVLSLIVPNILLSVVFFVFLFPIALLNRLIKKSDLLHLQRQQKSVWITVNKHFQPDTIKNPW
jgi:hypothetical protein